MALHVVTGPPAAGKSTFVREHAQPGDIRIDFDELANTLAGVPAGNHEHGPATVAVARAARTAAIAAARKHSGDVDVWLIHSTPSPTTLDQYRQDGAEIHQVDPGRDVVMKRIKTMRPSHMHAVAARWYEQQGQAGSMRKRTTTERGLGWRHRQQRERLLAVHRDGAPCWWCGKGMWRDPQKNWDEGPLDADHSLSRRDHGPHVLADRLLHRTCNRQRGDGRRDHLRPAFAQDEEVPERAAVFDWG